MVNKNDLIKFHDKKWNNYISPIYYKKHNLDSTSTKMQRKNIWWKIGDIQNTVYLPVADGHAYQLSIDTFMLALWFGRPFLL